MELVVITGMCSKIAVEGTYIGVDRERMHANLFLELRA